MRFFAVFAIAAAAAVGVTACSSSDSPAPAAPGGTGGTGTGGTGTGGTGTGGSAAGAAGTGGSSAGSGTGGASAGASGTGGTSAGAAGTSAGASGTDGSGGMEALDGGGDAAPSMCTAALEMLLAPIDKVSTGAVTILTDANGVRTVYVDASAGSFQTAAQNPRTYIDLATATKVALTDKQAPTSTAWDLAIKRPVLFSNDGDGGPGAGGTIQITKAFDQVTAADAMGLMLETESFVDADCNPMTDSTGAIFTSMTNWYDYDQTTMILTPKPGTTYIVRGASGKLYKLAILDYYAKPDGTKGTVSGRYLLQIGAL